MEVTLSNYAITLLSLLADRMGVYPLFELSRSASAQHIPLCENPNAYYIRRDRRDRQRVISVFDQNGQKIYTFERKTQFSPIWSLLHHPSRQEVATLHAGLREKTIDFHKKPGLQHRQIQPSPLRRHQQFYLTDGAQYQWSSASGYLEKVVNPGGGDEERRERVAKARLMRQYRFDWELLVDPHKLDKEVALATAFVSMVTQWGLGSNTGTRGPTLVPKQLRSGPNYSLSLQAPLKPEKQFKQMGADHDHEKVPSEANPVQIENRVYLVLEKPDGTRTEPVDLGKGRRQTYAPGFSKPVSDLIVKNGTVAEK